MTVSGSFTTPDGRPLANATVDFTPAASLAATASAGSLPRPFTTTTGAQGGFSVGVDQGTYDITVRPEEGTNFPWAVLANSIVGSTNRTYPPLAVPVPAILDILLEDFEGNPIEGAVVQAYAFVPATPLSLSGAYVQIGESITNSQGNFTMLAAAPLAE